MFSDKTEAEGRISLAGFSKNNLLEGKICLSGNNFEISVYSLFLIYMVYHNIKKLVCN